MHLTVFQCQGCGNLYQDRTPATYPQPPGCSTQPQSVPAVPGLGESRSHLLELNKQNEYDPATALARVLCNDCAAAVARAIQDALSTR